ncbi:MAG: alpha-galactosidase [Treponema sp.]|nr:alpha-galactosidase [Treponema sp.]
MPVFHDPGTGEFHLRNDFTSYILRVHEGGQAGQLYFGPALAAGRSYRHLSPGEFASFDNGAGDFSRLECPVRGSGDFRAPALVAEQADGSTVLDLVYVAHRVYAGKRPIAGLPSTYVESDDEADTLELDLADARSGLVATLGYTIFRDFPAIARRMELRNGGQSRLILRCAMSASLDLPDPRWELLSLSGAWARERHLAARALAPGSQGVSSERGASGHQHNPFIALKRPGVGEAGGEVYGFSLVYSGNFLAEAEVDSFGITRTRIGIDPAGFAWTLEPGESFRTPEAVLAYSASGLGALSETYHRLYRTRLARGVWRDKARPVLVNNWEGTYFDFTESRLLGIAGVARDLGVELFVLDDGWFGRRDDDTSSLGDWAVDERKLPGGLASLARRVEAMGLKFGLWIEPEMVSPRSELFAAHPDWAIGVPGRPRTETRNQYVLDLSRPEIVEHLYGVIAGLLRSAPVSYLKWDMNRNITEPYGAALPPGRQGEFFHRYTLGLYSLLDRITREFPGLLVESCASGGGRFDPGLLAYAPQAWVSDDTDAVERLKIQWGTSLCYPLSSMGAHVSAVPNHQVGRITPLSTRAAAAFFGVFGYELDAAALSPAERAEILDQVAFYKRHRELIATGRFLRLLSPFEGDGNEVAWSCVSEDGNEALVGFYRVLNRPFAGPRRLRLRGLSPAKVYRVSTWPEAGDPVDADNAGLRGGDELMGAGLLLSAERGYGSRRGDFWSRIFELRAGN